MNEHLKVLKNLLEIEKNGDEHGFRPDLTESEIEAIKWAIEKIESEA